MEDAKRNSYTKAELEKLSYKRKQNEIFVVHVTNPLNNSTECFFSDSGLDTHTDNNEIGVMYTAHSGERVLHYVDIDNIFHVEPITEIQLKEFVNY